MGYNIDFTRFKSSGLAGLDCGSYLKIPRRDYDITITEVYDGDLEVGQCVSMVRVPAGARITGLSLSWAGTAATVLAVGDPYACGRLSMAISTAFPRGAIQPGGAIQGCLAWGTCGTLVKTGRVGDGCGLFYQYTCETDIVVTNLYAASQANEGGWVGGAVAAGLGPVGTKWTGGRLVLEVRYKQQS